MRILLVQPPKSTSSIAGDDISVFEPLGLEYVASGVVDNHEVRILDMRIDADLKRHLREFHPDIVGITSFTVHVNPVRRILNAIKNWNKDTYTVVGGIHATIRPEDFLEASADIVVSGEGVFTFRDIVRRISSGEDIGNIPGTSLMRNGTVVSYPQDSFLDLDALPFPDRTLTAKYRKNYFLTWMQPIASVRTSKGCPFRCNFCVLWKLADGKYLKRKPEEIVRELEEVQEPFVFLADDESFIDTERMMALAAQIRQKRIKKRYLLHARSDTVARNLDLVKAWKEIGLERVLLGLESFKKEDLDHFRKHSTIGENERAIAILRDLRIELHASFIIRPEFTREDFRSFGDYCRNLELSFPTFSVLTPFPGTDLFEDTKDRFLTRNFEYFDLCHAILPTTLPLEEFYRELYGLYRGVITRQVAVSFLKKFPRRRIPSEIIRWYRVLRQVRCAYTDYAAVSPPGLKEAQRTN